MDKSKEIIKNDINDPNQLQSDGNDQVSEKNINEMVSSSELSIQREFDDKREIKDAGKIEEIIQVAAELGLDPQNTDTNNESGEAESGEAESDEAESDEAESDEAESDEAESDEAESDEAESDEAESDEAESDEAESGEDDIDEDDIDEDDIDEDDIDEDDIDEDDIDEDDIDEDDIDEDDIDEEKEEEDLFKGLFEAVLFLSNDPVPISFFVKNFSIDATQAKIIIDSLVDEYEERDGGIRLIEISNGFQFVTSARYSEQIRYALGKKKKETLTKGMLETLAIIAYKQPIVFAEIDELRGVSSRMMVANLMKKNLVKPVGRMNLPGRPLAYGTTDEFLRYFGLNKLSDLPKLSEIKEFSLDNED